MEPKKEIACHSPSTDHQVPFGYSFQQWLKMEHLGVSFLKSDLVTNCYDNVIVTITSLTTG